MAYAHRPCATCPEDSPSPSRDSRGIASALCGVIGARWRTRGWYRSCPDRKRLPVMKDMTMRRVLGVLMLVCAAPLSAFAQGNSAVVGFGGYSLNGFESH